MIFDKKTVSGKRKALDAKSAKRFSRLRILVITILVIVIAGTGLIGASAVYGTYKGILEVSPDIGAIDVSPKGFSTFETFVNAKNSGIKRAAVVTSDFHQFRCVNTGRLMGLDIVSTSMRFRPYFTRWRYWFRERLAVYADMIKVLRYRMKYRSPRRDGLK